MKEFDELFQAERQKLVQPLPMVLYHYTGVKGFMGIISCGKLRLSNILYMNDASELHYGRSLVEDVFRELRNDPAELPGLSSRLDELRRTNNIFAFSMSGAKNDLSQWKAYAGGLGGFSIGFNVRSNVDVQVNEHDGKDERFSRKHCL